MSNMLKIPLFDSLTHPTLSGDWFLPKHPQAARIGPLLAEMKKSHVRWGFAVGLRGIGDYDEARYAHFIKNNSDTLFPVAYLDIGPYTSSRFLMMCTKSLARKGYFGVKINPRLSKITLDHPALPDAIRSANDRGLAVLLCTYFYDNTKGTWKNSPESLARLLERTAKEKVILLHGGAVRLLEYAEITRAFPNTLLDLSFTICKYIGSSLDADIRFLFRTFDQRICLGSDHPEFALSFLRRRFETFTQDLSRNKAENIAFKNIVQFTGLEKYV